MDPGRRHRLVLLPSDSPDGSAIRRTAAGPPEMTRRPREWWLAPPPDGGVLRSRVDHANGLAYIQVRTAPAASSLRVSGHVVLDLDPAGYLVGIELLALTGHEGPGRVLVCGGREYGAQDYRDAVLLAEVLDALNPGSICHDAQRGADRLADAWSQARMVPCFPYPADWKRYRKAAGPIRNRRMLADFRPDLVLAFPGGPGTRDMVAASRTAGFPVVMVAARAA